MPSEAWLCGKKENVLVRFYIDKCKKEVPGVKLKPKIHEQHVVSQTIRTKRNHKQISVQKR